MTEQRLLNSRDYFENVVKLAYERFSNSEANFLDAYSLAMGLYHMHEWVFHHDLAKVKSKFGIEVRTAGKLWKFVESEIEGAGLIRDMNNAAKHVKLQFDPGHPQARDPSTEMHDAANTSIASFGYGEGSFGIGPFGGKSFFVLDVGGKTVSLRPVATDVYNYWECLIKEFYPDL